MGNSLLIGGAMLGMDVRIVRRRRSCWPRDEYVAMRHGHRRRSPARGSRITDDVDEGVDGADFIHTDVWVSMGEPNEVWKERIELLQPYQVNAEADDGDRQPATSSSCTACRPSTTPRPRSARRSPSSYGMHGARGHRRGLRVRPQSIVFDQAENRMHTIKAILVATLARTEPCASSSPSAATRCCGAASR